MVALTSLSERGAVLVTISRVEYSCLITFSTLANDGYVSLNNSVRCSLADLSLVSLPFLKDFGLVVSNNSPGRSLLHAGLVGAVELFNKYLITFALGEAGETNGAAGCNNIKWFVHDDQH